MSHHTNSEQIAEFKGTTKQALTDITDRLGRVEAKLDRVIERNMIVSAFVSLVTAVLVGVTTLIISRK